MPGFEMLEKSKSICFTQRNKMQTASFIICFVHKKYTEETNKNAIKNT